MIKTRKQRKQYGNKKQYGGENLPLHNAVIKDDLLKVSELIKEGVDVNLTDSDGYSALMMAVARNNIEIVEELLKVPEIDLNIQDIYMYNTALIFAIENNNNNIVKLLVNKPNIDINLKNREGLNALLLTLSHQYDINMILDILAVNTIDINAQRHDGYTALMLAIMNIDNTTNLTNVVTRILAKPTININLQSYNGVTALMVAVAHEKIPIIQLLLADPRIDVNVQTNEGRTAFLLTRNTQIRNLLIAAGANTHQIPEGRRPVNAMQVHKSFKKVKVDEFLKFMKEKVGNKNSEIPTTNSKLSEYIKSKLNSFIKSNNNTIKPKLNAIYTSHINNTTKYSSLERILFFYTLEYVSLGHQSDIFKQNYVQSFAKDCTEAYNTGYMMSCRDGIKERILLSLESAIGAVGINPEYKKILHYIDSTKYHLNTNSVSDAEYNRLMNQFGSVCTEEGATKQTFINCMKDKLQEELKERYDELDVIRKLNEYANSTGYFNNNGSGGRRIIRKKYKFNKSRKSRK